MRVAISHHSAHYNTYIIKRVCPSKKVSELKWCCTCDSFFPHLLIEDIEAEGAEPLSPSPPSTLRPYVLQGYLQPGPCFAGYLQPGPSFAGPPPTSGSRSPRAQYQDYRCVVDGILPSTTVKLIVTVNFTVLIGFFGNRDMHQLFIFVTKSDKAPQNSLVILFGAMARGGLRRHRMAGRVESQPTQHNPTRWPGLNLISQWHLLSTEGHQRIQI